MEPRVLSSSCTITALADRVDERSKNLLQPALHLLQRRRDEGDDFLLLRVLPVGHDEATEAVVQDGIGTGGA